MLTVYLIRSFRGIRRPEAARDLDLAGLLVDDEERRAAMSQAALHRSQSFRLTDRARRILAFLSTLC